MLEIDQELTFDDFDLDGRCLSVLHAMDITVPTPVQAQAIPIALSGSDLVATAQTGTGKTLAFSLPTLTRLAGEKRAPNRMLVLVPTRELCVQVEDVIRGLCKALKLRSVQVYGGVGLGPQSEKLKRGCDIIVATPGRLLDHISRRSMHFDNLEVLIFDEADRMLDMGFLPDIQRILRYLPRERQTLMFSATFAPELERLTQDMMHEPKRVTVGAVAMPVESVRQLVVPVREENKTRMLLDLLKEEEIESGLIFLRTKLRTDRLAHALKRAGYKAAPIHGDLSQKLRQRALEGFRKGKYDILVATDVAARGLDIDDISHVINYDIPLTPDDYVHRIGRTARADREGDAVTFVTPTEHAPLGAIERTIGYNIERKEYEGAPRILSLFTPASAARRSRGRGGVRRGGRGLLRRR